MKTCKPNKSKRIQKSFLFSIIMFFVSTLIGSSQIFKDDYSTGSLWTQESTYSGDFTWSKTNLGDITVNNNVCKIDRVGGYCDKRVFRSITNNPITATNSWAAEIEFTHTAWGNLKSGGEKMGAGHNLLALTTDSLPFYISLPITINSFSVDKVLTDQDGIAIEYVSIEHYSNNNYKGDAVIRGRSKYGKSIGLPSIGIEISDSTKYYLRIERVDLTHGRVSVFSDSLRTIHVANSPQCFAINDSLGALNYVQHSNKIVASPTRIISGTIDNLKIYSKQTPSLSPISFNMQQRTSPIEFCDKSGIKSFHVNSVFGPTVSYSWQTSGNIISNQDTLILVDYAGFTGTDIVTVTTTQSCLTLKKSLEVSIVKCCFAATDPEFTKILAVNNDSAANKINDYSAWSGKYYFEPGAVLTVADNATLDLTNVDIVFSPCSKIVFEDNTTIRANNSVFRPCNMSESWIGFEFNGAVDGIISECIYKNALIALNFVNIYKITTVQITNNLFSNNRIALNIETTQFNEDITGNTFLLDDPTIFDSIEICPIASYRISADEYYGIRLLSSVFVGIISQNDFVNQPEDEFKKFYGLLFTRAMTRWQKYLVISKNNFTNMFRSVDIFDSEDISVENNDIEVTRSYELDNYQINVLSCFRNVNIVGNNIKNTNEYHDTSKGNCAIYFESSSDFVIKENIIEGFETAIQIVKSSSYSSMSSVVDNTIYNSDEYGIYIEDCERIDIACNKINMNLIDWQGRDDKVGISYRKNYNGPGGDPINTSKIRSNCIFESSHAIHLYFNSNGYNATQGIASIKNNYLFNYRDYGIANNGFYQFTNVIDVEKNTFVSNNTANGAVDLASTHALNVHKNYGILRTSSNISQHDANKYNSTASCGNQIGSDRSTYKIGEEEICEPSYDKFTGFQLDNEGKYVILDQDIVIDSEGGIGFIFMISIIKVLASNPTYTELNKFYDFVISENVLNADENELFKYYYFLYQADNINASQVLNNTSFSDIDYSELAEIEKLYIDKVINEEQLSNLDNNEIILLESIDNRRGRYSDKARSLLHYSIGGHDHLFIPTEPVAEFKLSAEDIIAVEKDLFEIYPNPAKDIVKIRYYINEIEEAAISVQDIQGKLVLSKPLTFNAGETTFDCSNLEAGIYIVTISNTEGFSQHSRLVKY